jgi:ubiquinone/menaquinone biosynthesis C-methylase UbiE
MNEQTIKPDVADLYDLSWGYRAARVLHIANSLDIFTILSEKEMSVEQICQRVEGKSEITEKLLVACNAMGLLEKHDSRYKNSELAQTYLVRGGQLYQGNIIAHSASVWNFWHTLADEVGTEVAPADIKPDEHRDFIMGMDNIAVAGRARVFTETIDLSGRRKLFDVGGGPGTYSIAACKRYPKLRAVVFDLPETISIAREVIAKEEMQDRVSVQEGNWETDAFGEDNDVVLLSNVLHGAGSKAEMKLKKAYDSLVYGGLLVIQDFLLNDRKTGPLIPALFNIMVGAYLEAELLSMVEKAGFLEPEVVFSSERFGCGWITARKAAAHL